MFCKNAGCRGRRDGLVQAGPDGGAAPRWAAGLALRLACRGLLDSGGGRRYFESTMVTVASNHTVGLERRMDTGFGASSKATLFGAPLTFTPARESASGCGPQME